MALYSSSRNSIIKDLSSFNENKQRYYSAVFVMFPVLEYSDGEYSRMLYEDMFESFEYIAPELLEWFCVSDSKSKRLLTSMAQSVYFVMTTYSKSALVDRISGYRSVLSELKGMSPGALKLRNDLDSVFVSMQDVVEKEWDYYQVGEE